MILGDTSYDRPSFIVYFIKTCPYCHKAISLLQDLDIDHTLVEVTLDNKKNIMDEYSMKSVPIIVDKSSKRLIGGYDDLFYQIVYC